MLENNKIQNRNIPNERIYIAIDLKSFYASVECVERKLDPLTANLVVADESRTAKTICLAVSPSLKAYGIPGRARLFEVIQKAKKYNLEYIAAPPRMALYMQYSTRIYGIYLKYIAPEDIHVYSVDEVFMDVTQYLKLYNMDARSLAEKIINDVLSQTGITATAGIGTNLYLCKVAMDIVAKHIEPDENGVRIAYLDEKLYREKLWSHTPITDFWRVGKGYATKLKAHGIYTMGDIARCSIGKDGDFYNEDLLYKLFGINAELLIDHAWGYEPCTIEEIKKYKPRNNSLSSGQVLHEPYDYEKTRLIIKEMTDLLVLQLVDKALITDQIVITIGYDIENLTNEKIKNYYKGEITTDHYGRKVPKHAHGTINLKRYTSSTVLIMEAALKLYDDIIDRNLLVRRINITANHVVGEKYEQPKEQYEQLELFVDYEEKEKQEEKENLELEKERKLQHALLDVKKKYGKNAILRGMNLEEGATARQRNNQIGGHQAFDKGADGIGENQAFDKSDNGTGGHQTYDRK